MEAKEITEEKFIECLAIDFPHFKVTKSNLTHPTSHFVISFYALILRHVIDLEDPEEIWNLTEDQRYYMNNCHSEASTFGQHVWASNLHAAVKYVFSQLSQNGSEFVYSDIIFPENTPRRSFVFMALMLNFYWYSNDFADEVNKDMNACLQEVQHIHSLKADKEKLINQLKECEDQRSHYVDLIKDIKKSIKKFSDLNEEKENVMKDLIAKEESFQKDLEKVEEKEQKLQEAHTKLQNKKKYAESLVVSNPNQVIDVHQKCLKKKDECVKKIKMLEEQNKTASSRLQQSNKVLQLQQKLNDYLRDEKFTSNSQGNHKGFQVLFESINLLVEKKKKIAEEESVVKQEISKCEDKLSKLKSEHAQNEQQWDEIMLKGKDKMNIYTNLIENQKKNHAQLLLKMRKDTEEMDEFEAMSLELNLKCDDTEEKIKKYDSNNAERYSNYVKEIRAALLSIQSIFE